MIFLYVDPGSGTMVWQLIMAFFFGLLFYAGKLRTWLSRHLKRGRRNTDALPPVDSSNAGARYPHRAYSQEIEAKAIKQRA
jgi:hypothetical protein